MTKTVARPIAPAPGAHGTGTAIKPIAAHQISGLTPAALKKGNNTCSSTVTLGLSLLICPHCLNQCYVILL